MQRSIISEVINSGTQRLVQLVVPGGFLVLWHAKKPLMRQCHPSIFRRDLGLVRDTQSWTPRGIDMVMSQRVARHPSTPVARSTSTPQTSSQGVREFRLDADDARQSQLGEGARRARRAKTTQTRQSGMLSAVLPPSDAQIGPPRPNDLPPCLTRAGPLICFCRHGRPG